MVGGINTVREVVNSQLYGGWTWVRDLMEGGINTVWGVVYYRLHRGAEDSVV